MSTAIAPAGEKSTILIVEDETGIARMIQVLLEARGFATMVCHTGDAALRQMADRPADLVLLDVMMPGMDGYEVCRQIRQRYALAPIQVVMISGLEQRGDLEQLLEYGADDFFSKPITSLELCARVRAAVIRLQDHAQYLAGKAAATGSGRRGRISSLLAVLVEALGWSAMDVKAVLVLHPACWRPSTGATR